MSIPSVQFVSSRVETNSDVTLPYARTATATANILPLAPVVRVVIVTGDSAISK